MSKHKPKIAISVDWDFFFNEKLDWDFGHREAPFFIYGDIWQIRLLGNPDLLKDFKANVHDVKHFWEVLDQKKLLPAALAISESHMYAFQLYHDMLKPDVVINFDAHPDMKGANMTYVDCGNWLSQYLSLHKHAKAYWVRPEHVTIDMYKDSIDNSFLSRFDFMTWKQFQKQFVLNGQVLMGFVCRSGAWTPPWEDDAFDSFINATNTINIPMGEHPPIKRLFKIPSAEELAEYAQHNKQLLEQYRKTKEAKDSER